MTITSKLTAISLFLAKLVYKLLADKCHHNMQHVVELAIKHYKKLQYFEELNRSFAKLKENEEAWDVTLADDMENPSYCPGNYKMSCCIIKPCKTRY
jgi:hypothetical protein